MTVQTRTVGFVGLGAMGSRMAARLLAAHFKLVVYNRTPERADALRAQGAEVVSTPAEVAERTDVVCGCLLDSAAVAHVYGSAQGLISKSRRGQIYVEHGTFAPQLARDLAGQLGQRGATMLDAPVTGGPEAASAGELTVMVGGPEGAVADMADVFGAYAGRVLHIGASGSGLQLKLVNQLLVTCHVAAAAEASAMIQRLDLPLAASAQVLNAGWGASAMLARTLRRLQSGDLGVSEATIGGLIEPQRLLRDLAQEAGVTLSTAAAAAQMFTDACEAGNESADLAAMVLVADAGASPVDA
jgi:3-hydroxyisobutyrate dehydrogenase-like beta-hydroxyacid dehydrogenase